MKPQMAFMSRDSQVQLRGLQMGNHLEADSLFFKSEDDIIEKPDFLSHALIVFVPVLDLKKESEISARVQAIRYGAPEAWLVVIGDKKISAEGALFLKKSGAQVVITEDTFLNTIVPEFIASQKMHGQWCAIKATELAIDKVVPFNLFHFMPLNKKFVLFSAEGSLLDTNKVEKAKKVGELYFKRDDLPLFQKYISDYEDMSATGLAARCRHQYMSASLLFKDLALHLVDESEQSSFQAGKVLYDHCYEIADNFVMSLGTLGDAWPIINNASFDDLTPLDRAPAIGAMASLLSIHLDIGNPTAVFLGALLADIGLLQMPPRILGDLRSGSFQHFDSQTLSLYRQHPLLSVNMALSRKLPLDDDFRQILLGTHEFQNGKGFPNGWLGEKIPKESELIHLAQILDQATLIREGKERKAPHHVQRETIEGLKNSGTLSLDLLINVLSVLPT